MYMVRGVVDILFHKLDTGGRGQGKNNWEEWIIFSPRREGGVYSFQTLTAGIFFYASLTHI